MAAYELMASAMTSEELDASERESLAKQLDAAGHDRIMNFVKGFAGSHNSIRSNFDELQHHVEGDISTSFHLGLVDYEIIPLFQISNVD